MFQRLFLSVANPGSHASLLTSNFSSTFAGFLRTHLITTPIFFRPAETEAQLLNTGQ